LKRRQIEYTLARIQTNQEIFKNIQTDHAVGFMCQLAVAYFDQKVDYLEIAGFEGCR